MTPTSDFEARIRYLEQLITAQDREIYKLKAMILSVMQSIMFFRSQFSR